MASSRRMLAAVDGGDNCDDDDGLTRVIDALMCHMWPGMIRKTPTFGGGAKAVPDVVSVTVPAEAAVAEPESAAYQHVAAAGEAGESIDGDGIGHFTTDEDDDSFSR